MRYSILWVSTVLFVFFGCASKHYVQNKGAIVTIKTPTFKFSDLGYIRQSGEEIELELFVSGQVIDKFEIDTLICTSRGCMRKSTFNENYLSPYYPDTILKDILERKPIYNGENLEKTSSGFVQNIVTKEVNIKYSVTTQMIRFKDSKNGILIKIKNIKG